MDVFSYPNFLLFAYRLHAFSELTRSTPRTGGKGYMSRAECRPAFRPWAPRATFSSGHHTSGGGVFLPHRAQASYEMTQTVPAWVSRKCHHTRRADLSRRCLVVFPLDGELPLV